MTNPTGQVSAAAANPPSTGPRMRASDADRHATVEVLQDAMARGLLTPAEASDRMSAAYHAVHLDDLKPITADLPPEAARSTSPGWRPLLLMVLEQLQSSLGGAVAGRRRPAQLGAALLIVVVLLTCGLIFAHLVLDNGGRPDHGGFGPR